SPSLTDAVESVVMSGLARDPAQRTANAQQFAAALSAATGAVSISESPTLLRQGSSTANDPTVLSESESTVTRVSPRVEINVPKTVRPSLLILLFIVASVLFGAALLSAGGYYIYSRSRQTTEPIVTTTNSPGTQSSQPGAKPSSVNDENNDAASYYAEGK